jgi:phenylpyruvate tautomerase PptA (4-oxalocrotonate tautomerase family)
MPYLQLDVPGHYSTAVKRELATRLCTLYARVMETQLWRPNIGIRELGENNLFHLGPNGLEAVTMVLGDIRRGRPAAQRLVLAQGIVDICVETLKVPRSSVLAEFTQHDGDEIHRDGTWAEDWDPKEASAK